MKNWVKILMMSVVLVGFAVMNTGCVSYYAMKHGEKKAAIRKATIKGDQAAIKAIDLGANAAGVGIDISNWEAITEDPLTQFGAAILDAGLIYAGKKIVDNNSGGGSSTVPGANSSTTINVNNADHTSVTVDNSTTTTDSHATTTTDSHSGNGNNR